MQKGQKRLTLILLPLLMVLFVGIISAQKICCHSAVKQPCMHADNLTEEEILAFFSQAHYATVKLFSQAFEDELYNGGKSSWPEVRPQLLQYWSAQIVDNELKDFYEHHLQAWGYEIGFVFPLWKAENILEYRILNKSGNNVVAEFMVPTSYEAVETIQLVLVCDDGHWVIGSGFTP
ncbi:MAG: hypothetical protein GX197_05305 [Firmicutes bacterium]|nr:hypothetical protein [Bacillota bacterium]